MATRTIIPAIGILAGMLSGLAVASATTPGTLTERILIGSNRVETNGCHSATERFTTHVPNAENLDRSYNGPLSGIQVERVTGNGQISNLTWAADGRNVTYQLSAKGAGHWVNPPKAFGVKLGGGACVGAKGAWVQVNVYGVYKTVR